VKQCSMCGDDKPESEFNSDSSRVDGLQRECRECNRQRARDWYRENRRRKIAYSEAYKAEHGHAPKKAKGESGKAKGKTEIEELAERLGINLEPEPPPHPGEEMQGRTITLSLPEWRYLEAQGAGVSDYLRSLVQRDMRRVRR